MWVGHGILCPSRLKKWGDTSPVSPTKLRPWLWVSDIEPKSFNSHNTHQKSNNQILFLYSKKQNN